MSNNPAENEYFLNHGIIRQLSPIALRKAKNVYNFGLSEYNRVKETDGFCLSYAEPKMQCASKPHCFYGH